MSWQDQLKKAAIKLGLRCSETTRMAGYSYAQSYLRKHGTPGVAYLQGKVSEARMFGDHDAFDEGVSEAIQEWTLEHKA